MSKVEKKKRGRKPKKVDFDEEMLIEESSFEIKEQLIIHLPIKHDDLINIDFEKLTIQDAYNLDKTQNVNEGNQVKNPKEEIFNNSDRSLAKSSEIKVNTYFSLPSESWNFDNTFVHKKTDICCWWCTCGFDTYPVYLPIRYVDNEDYFNVKGIFCSFECTAAYGLKYEKNMRSLYLLKFFYKRIHKSKGVADISPAPPKEILNKYGGPASIDDFRTGFHFIHGYSQDNQHNIKEQEQQIYFIHDFPVKYIPMQIGRKRIKSMIDTSVKMIKKKNKPINLK